MSENIDTVFSEKEDFQVNSSSLKDVRTFSREVFKKLNIEFDHIMEGNNTSYLGYLGGSNKDTDFENNDGYAWKVSYEGKKDENKKKQKNRYFWREWISWKLIN